MTKKRTIRKAQKDAQEGKAATTQAGEFVKETIDDARAGRIGVRSTKQAIAIGLSKARRAGVDLPPPAKGKVTEKTRASARNAYEAGQTEPDRPVNPKRSKAITKALQREGHAGVSHEAVSRQAKSQSRTRSAAERSASAKKGAATRLAHQTPQQRQAIARKAAKTRQARAGQ